LPYIDRGEASNHNPETLMRVSAARCAAISYLRPDVSVEKELEICEKLVTHKHSAPLEHTGTSFNVPQGCRSGPMVGWKTLRTILGQDGKGFGPNV
jgi:hypothetical protein